MSLVPISRIRVGFSFDDSPEPLQAWEERRLSSPEDHRLRLDAEHIALRKGFDELLSLSTLNGVEILWYQIETVKKALKHFRGRVLLADEVGLGKTIEACILLKEYLMRGLIRRILILTPPSLVSQWREELREKFSLEFITTEEGGYRDDPPAFWQENLQIIASLHVAKSPEHAEILSRIPQDLVIVDEAHHLKNRQSRNWQLVNSLTTKFLFLLTATPIQNDMMELYNLVTLLRPGTLKTAADFRRRFITRGNPLSPKNRHHLRELLGEVMVRNTRSLADVRLPRRYASTLIVEPDEGEQAFYQEVGSLVKAHYDRKDGLDRLSANTLLMEAGSSPYAVRATLQHLLAREGLSHDLRRSLHRCLDLARSLPPPRKAKRLVELLKSQREKKIVFTHFRESQRFLADLFEKEGIPYSLFHGGLSSREKDEAVARFQEEVPVFLATESGGEGRNLQFANTMINFDLPWNPLRIEQRIGRIHRIGQRREVFIFNLANRLSLEERILSVLDRKLNLFELVIGELDLILGSLSDERDFPDIVLDLWLKAADEQELEQGFTRLGEELLQAKEQYLAIKQLDEQLFGEEYEV